MTKNKRPQNIPAKDYIDARCASVESRFNASENRMERIVERLITHMDTIQAENRQEFAKIDARFQRVDQQFEQMNQQFEQKFEQVNKRFEQVDHRLDQMDDRISLFDKHLTWKNAVTLSFVLPVFFATFIPYLLTYFGK
jgi:chromosome segregation ATPase